MKKIFGNKKKQEREREEREKADLRMQLEQAQRFNEFQQQQLRAKELEAQEQLQAKEREMRQALERQQYEQRELERVKQRELNRQAQAIKDDQARRRERMKKTTPEALRDLRDLIRQRYQLDMHIWSLKGARAPDRPIVEESMEKADSVLQEICAMVETWEENEAFWTPQEWALASRIKEQVMKGGKRVWRNNPPWNEV